MRIIIQQHPRIKDCLDQSNYQQSIYYLKKVMRHRSGGVHCQSYEELIDILETHTQRCPNCQDIDQLLAQQQSHPESYSGFYFNQADEMKQDEQQELSKSIVQPNNSKIITTKIVIICQQLHDVLSQLLHKPSIEQFYSQQYQCQTSPFIHIESNRVCVCQHHENILQKRVFELNQNTAQVFDSCEQDSFTKLRDGSLNNVQNDCRSLELVIYYNLLQLGSTRKNQQQQRQYKIAYQHKIWLVQALPALSPLINTYINSSHYIFHAHPHTESNRCIHKNKYTLVKPIIEVNCEQTEVGVLSEVINRVQRSSRPEKF